MIAWTMLIFGYFIHRHAFWRGVALRKAYDCVWYLHPKYRVMAQIFGYSINGGDKVYH
jgi:hypothetical protein